MDEKKRVGILTLYYDNCNYGAVLQAYALQKVLDDLGYDAIIDDLNQSIETIRKLFEINERAL